jgi:hypothetical protein
MKRAAGFLAALTLSACAAVAEAPPQTRLKPADLAVISGTGWTGTLTYRDYSPPYGEVTISAELAATETPDGLNLSYLYPKEPQANSEGLFALTEDGAVLDGGRITSLSRTEDGLMVTTEEACEDDNTPATCVRDYSFSTRAFTAAKRVRFAGDPETFLRNVYRFTRP